MRVLMTANKKKTLTGVLKRFSIAELEVLNKANPDDLKTAIDTVLLTKKVLRRMQDKYEKL